MKKDYIAREEEAKEQMSVDLWCQMLDYLVNGYVWQLTKTDLEI